MTDEDEVDVFLALREGMCCVIEKLHNAHVREWYIDRLLKQAIRNAVRQAKESRGFQGRVGNVYRVNFK